jgi:hypothetical protein
VEPVYSCCSYFHGGACTGMCLTLAFYICDSSCRWMAEPLSAPCGGPHERRSARPRLLIALAEDVLWQEALAVQRGC